MNYDIDGGALLSRASSSSAFSFASLSACFCSSKAPRTVQISRTTRHHEVWSCPGTTPKRAGTWRTMPRSWLPLLWPLTRPPLISGKTRTLAFMIFHDWWQSGSSLPCQNQYPLLCLLLSLERNLKLPPEPAKNACDAHTCCNTGTSVELCRQSLPMQPAHFRWQVTSFAP